MTSIGTGECKSVIPENHLANFGLARWAPTIIELGIGATMEANDKHIEQLLPPEHYHRIQHNIATEYEPMDENHVERLRDDVGGDSEITKEIDALCKIFKKDGLISTIGDISDSEIEKATDAIYSDNPFSPPEHKKMK